MLNSRAKRLRCAMLLAAGVLVWLPACAPDDSLLPSGTVAPDFTVQDSLGNPVHLSDYKGKVVVLDFWATWCGPCQESLPSTNTVAQQYADKGVVFLGVNIWDTTDAFKTWLPEHANLNAIKFVIDPSPNGNDIASTAYKVTGIPAQYVVGRDGKIVRGVDGYGGSDDDLIAGIQSALAAKG